MKEREGKIHDRILCSDSASDTQKHFSIDFVYASLMTNYHILFYILTNCVCLSYYIPGGKKEFEIDF